MKRCSKCKEVLTVENGIVRKTGPATGKFRSECRKCGTELAKAWKTQNPDRVREQSRNWKAKHPEKAAGYKRKSAYGISVAEFESLVCKQGNLCGICRGPMVPSKNQHVDHNHETGEIRGLLCSKCNTGLGLLGDSPELLRAAAAYLEACAPPECVAVSSTG